MTQVELHSAFLKIFYELRKEERNYAEIAKNWKISWNNIIVAQVVATVTVSFGSPQTKATHYHQQVI